MAPSRDLALYLCLHVAPSFAFLLLSRKGVPLGLTPRKNVKMEQVRSGQLRIDSPDEAKS